MAPTGFCPSTSTWREALALWASRGEGQRVLRAIPEVSLLPHGPRGAESHTVCPEIDRAAAAGPGKSMAGLKLPSSC